MFASGYSSVIGWLRGALIRGILALLPVVLTIAIGKYLFTVLNRWLEPIQSFMPASLRCIPHVELVLIFLFIVLVGGMLPHLGIGRLVDAIEHSIFKRIPLVNHVYFAIKQLTNAWRPENKMTFKHVVMVQFPRPDFYSIGFLTNEVPPAVAPRLGVRYLSVFVPTTPNPTTGFYLMVPETECQIINMTRQEAMSIIISGGIIQPERFASKDI